MSMISLRSKRNSAIVQHVAGFLFIVLVAGGTIAQAADFWEKKEYRKWSLKECRKMLQNSPWSKKRTYSQVLNSDLRIGAIATTPGDPTAGTAGNTNNPNAGNPTISQTGVGDRGRETNPRLTYQAQFRSALPVRQAMVRMRMLQLKYDEMAPEQQAEFDAQAARFLDSNFSDRVVVYVSFNSNVQQDELTLVQHWRRQTLDSLRNFTYLNGAKGVRAPLLSYTVSRNGRGFQFTFPREVDGRPLVSPKDKSLQLEFIHPNIRKQGEKRVLLSFKIKKMLMDGEPVF